MARKAKPADDKSMIHGPDELRELADTVLLMEAWCKAVRALLVSQIERGVKIPGIDLEPTFSPREWDAMGLEDEVLQKTLQGKLKRLGFPSTLDVVAPRKTLSPAGLEKIVGKPVFAEHLADLTIARPTGNSTLKIGSVAKAKKSLLTKAPKPKEDTLCRP